MLQANLLLAIGYFLGGYVGSLLSIPPNMGSPIWPAAGVALAGILTYGKQSIPGLWLGALCIQTYSLLDPTNQKNVLSSLSIGVSVGTIATIQAVFGAWLIKRVIGQANKALIIDGYILSFLLLGGPVSCVVSATLSLFVLYLHQAISTDNILFSWLTWWIGDVIGVLIFAPILLCFIGEPFDKWRIRIATVAFPLTVLFFLVAILFEFARREEQAGLAVLFNQRVNLLQNALQNKLDSHIEASQSVRAFFDSSREVSPVEFRSFTRVILRSQPSIKALAWIPLINRDNFSYYQQLLGGEWPIHTAKGLSLDISEITRNEIFPIAYLEPFDSNKSELGLDLSSDAISYGALKKARDSMRIVVAERETLALGKLRRPYVQIITPIYQAHQRLQTAEQRRQHLRGFILSSFIVEKKINEVINNFDDLHLTIKITDRENQLYHDIFQNFDHDSTVAGLKQTKSLVLADKRWTVHYAAAPEFAVGGLFSNIWWLIMSGLLFTGISSSFLLMLTGRTLKTEDLVKIRTHELKQESNERQLIIRRHSDHNRILQAIASPASLVEILELIVNTIEKQFPASLSSIMLLHEQGGYIQRVVAPSLPEFFAKDIEGLAIGEDVGDFGSAASSGQRVIVENIAQHGFWQRLTGLAQRLGLAASYSEPILSSMNQVLGTVTVFHKVVHFPEQALLSEVSHLAQLASITIERRATEKQITHLAYYDALTNLPNRRLFFDRLEQTLASALRYETHAALLYLDLDHFKTLNDSLGHDFGDELLVQVASRLKLCVRDEDTVARLGGDEFVLLLSSREASKEGMLERALTTAERVQSTLEVPYKLKEHVHHITPSIGITLLPQPDTTPGELLKQADTAMYHAKNRGRNSISFYSVEMQKRADQRLIMEKDLRVALSERQFSLHYQPQFDNEQRLIGAEALIRWQHPQKGMISPAEFIPVAEETSLILAISDWVLEEACLQLQKWPALPHIAVNISPKQFRQPEFEKQIAACLTKYGIPSSRLMLEITEGSIIEDIQDSIQKLQSMQNLGINISIDDFGTGYSSLAYLKMLPLNQLKIDQSFVRDINVDNNDAVIVETIIAMSKHLGLSVIAEGVETSEQLQFLRDRKCKGYQGYFFSRPLPADQFAGQFMVNAVLPA
jgi:diguanylate cyclase (GGDEF)-like protein